MKGHYAVTSCAFKHANIAFQKPTRHISEQSFSIGTIAECLEAIGPATSAFVQHLYPTINKLLEHEDKEIRSNSIFAMGVLAANGGDVVYPYPTK